MPRSTKKRSDGLGFQFPKPTVDQYRWLRVKVEGMTYEDVAKEDGISPDLVRRSVSTYDRNRSVLTLRELQAVEIGILQANAAREARAIKEALEATKVVQILDELGRPVVSKDGVPVRKVVPDHEVRMLAVEKRNEKFVALQPKVGPTTNIGVNTGVQIQATSPQESYEGRLLRIQEKRKLLMEGQDAEAVDAEVEDVEDEGESDDEGDQD